MARFVRKSGLPADKLNTEWEYLYRCTTWDCCYGACLSFDVDFSSFTRIKAIFTGMAECCYASCWCVPGYDCYYVKCDGPVTCCINGCYFVQCLIYCNPVLSQTFDLPDYIVPGSNLLERNAYPTNLCQSSGSYHEIMFSPSLDNYLAIGVNNIAGSINTINTSQTLNGYSCSSTTYNCNWCDIKSLYIYNSCGIMPTTLGQPEPGRRTSSYYIFGQFK